MYLNTQAIQVSMAKAGIKSKTELAKRAKLSVRSVQLMLTEGSNSLNAIIPVYQVLRQADPELTLDSIINSEVQNA